MNTRSLKPGDRVLVDVRGLTFPATVRSKQPRNLAVDPDDPIRFTFRHVSPHQVVRKLGGGA